MKKNIGFIVFLILILFHLPCQAVDKEKKRLVRVGVFSLEPINFIDRNNNAKGLYPGLIKEIAALENWKIEYIQGSWAQGLENLQTGKIDLMTTIAFSPERTKTMEFSKEPVIDIWGQIFTIPNGQIQTVLNLKDQKVAIMKRDINGHNFITTAKNFGIKCKIIEFDSHDEVFAAIRDGNVVAGVAPQHFGLRHTKEYNLVGTSIQFSPFSVFFATQKGQNLHLLKTIDFWLEKWKKDKSSIYYQQLSLWMNPNFERRIIPKWLLVSLFTTAGLLILLFFFNRMLKSQVIKKTKELKTSEKHYRELVENASTVILRWDTNGKIIFINQFGLDLFGHSKNNVIGQDLLDIISPLRAYSRKALFKMVENICITPEKYTLNETEHLIDKKEKLHLQWSNKPITDNDGNLKEILSVGTNISQRKYLEKHLMDAQKMEAIGTLAGGVAHDFNNILTVIMGNTELAYANQHDAEKITGNLDKVLSAVHRAKELTGQILAFSRESDLEKTPVNLSDITKETLSMIRSTLPSTIKINSQIVCKKTILANATQIHQVILNLCTNAFHAMENTGGTLTVSIQERPLNKNTLYPDGMDMKADTYLVLQIADTGAGISSDIIPKIFEPYYTTKKQGKGTGMGLAVAHSIIRDHNGHIRVDSTLGKGTYFDVYLPVAQGMNIEKAEITREKAKGGNENILIVDDEKPIVDALSTIVSNVGYSPTKFTDSTNALKQVIKNPGLYDLVITDMTMPEMTGLQLSQKILQICPNMPIIICTGYTGLLTREKALALGAAEYLQKPVLKNDLLTTIRTVLDKASLT